MPCEDTEKTICEVKASFIRQEIDNSFEYVKSQKALSLSVIKLYLLILYGLLAFVIFYETKILLIENPLVNAYEAETMERVKLQDASQSSSKNPIVIFPIVGIVFTFLVFFFGWVLLSYLSHIIAGIRKSYRHINSMRGFKVEFFDGFKAFSLMPIDEKDFSPIYSNDLPRMFGLVNLCVLLLGFYFLCFIVPVENALVFVMSVVFIISSPYLKTIRGFYLTLKKSDLIEPLQKINIMEEGLKHAIVMIEAEPKFKIVRILQYVFVFLFFIFFFYFICDRYVYGNVYFNKLSWLSSLILILVFDFVAISYYKEHIVLSRLTLEKLKGI